MVWAVRVGEFAQLQELQLPHDPGAQAEQIRAAVGGSAEAAYYHRDTVLHVHGNGRDLRLEANLAAWALACAWRGMRLPYLLYGPVVVTGPYDRDGSDVRSLPQPLGTQVRTVCATVRETAGRWRARQPASSDAALDELYADACHDLAALG